MLWMQASGLAGQELTMEAVGPTTLPFAPVAGAPTKHSAVLTVAGLYKLHVRLGGVAVPGWPRHLHVLPAPSEPSRCGAVT